jgi:hypothetical protein
LFLRTRPMSVLPAAWMSKDMAGLQALNPTAPRAPAETEKHQPRSGQGFYWWNRRLIRNQEIW